MAKKKSIKAKEPVRIRTKAVKGGNQSIYLDIYKDGQRSYKFLKLYLVPETSEAAKAQNANTMQAANAVKSQMIIELANSEAGIKVNPAKGIHDLDHRRKVYRNIILQIQIQIFVQHVDGPGGSAVEVTLRSLSVFAVGVVQIGVPVDGDHLHRLRLTRLRH